MNRRMFIALLLLIPSIQFIRAFDPKISVTEYAEMKLAVKLLKEIVQNGKSVAVSFRLVSKTLFKLYLAANGETKKQLQQFLGNGASGAKIRSHFGKFQKAHDEEESGNFMFDTSSRFYIQKGLSVRKNFLNILQVYCNEKLYEFCDQDQVIEEMNEWIWNSTNNKIVEMVKSDDVNWFARIFILNAIYFKDTWEKRCSEYEIRRTLFHVSEREKKLVSVVVAEDYFPYFENKYVEVVKVPYFGNKIEMLFILPKIRFGLPEVLQNLRTRELLRYIAKATPKRLAVMLPKFQLEGKLDLVEILQKIGIKYAFSKKANFGQLTDDSVFIGNIFHACIIETDVKEMESNSSKVTLFTDPLKMTFTPFIADHPFLFVIVENSKTVLFAGQYAN